MKDNDEQREREHDSEYEIRHRRSFFFPILLIAAGLIFLLSNMGYIEGSAMDIILRLWPLIFIVGGIDDLLKGDSISGPVLGIGIGSLLLLANLGYFQWSVWELIFRFWPIFLIAWGLDLIIGHRTTMQKLIGALVSLAIVVGMFWMVGVQPNFSSVSNSTRISQAADGIKTAEINIERPVGGTRISHDAASNVLISGMVPADGYESIDTNFRKSGDFGIYTVQSHGEAKGPIVIGANQTAWNLALTTAIPINLSLNTAVGESILDLTGTQVEEINAKMAVGRMEVRLPANKNLTGNISGAVGEIVIYVPRNTPVRINANTAVTLVNVQPDFHREGNMIYLPGPDSSSQGINLKVDLPVGLLSIRYLP
jgi:hypothetical protein